MLETKGAGGPAPDGWDGHDPSLTAPRYRAGQLRDGAVLVADRIDRIRRGGSLRALVRVRALRLVPLRRAVLSRAVAGPDRGDRLEPLGWPRGRAGGRARPRARIRNLLLSGLSDQRRAAGLVARLSGFARAPRRIRRRSRMVPAGPARGVGRDPGRPGDHGGAAPVRRKRGGHPIDVAQRLRAHAAHPDAHPIPTG